ncbi:MAG: TlpA disulfide reductase family protein, partial [Planctomycetia bacterium]|nr:TlpA disulfide reductase family protein [Planctomycetia bacterium]
EEAPEETPVENPNLPIEIASKEELLKALEIPSDATTEELMWWLRRIQFLNPVYLSGEGDQLNQRAEIHEFFALTSNARIVATDRILASESASQDMKMECIGVKASALQKLCQIDEETNEPRFEAFVRELMANEDPIISWHGERMLILHELAKRSEQPSPEELKADCWRVMEHTAKGVERKCLDPRFAMSVVQMVFASVEALPNGDSSELLGRLAEIFDSSGDQNLQAYVPWLNGCRLRLGLVGREIPFVWATYDDEDVRSEDYRGKHLFILFWSLRDPKSLHVLPSIMELYSVYNRRGWEIVAVCADPLSDEMMEVLDEAEFEWATVVDAYADDENEASLCQTLGIVSFPTIIYVGPEGRVVDPNFNLSNLVPFLETTFGTVEELAHENADSEEELEDLEEFFEENADETEYDETEDVEDADEDVVWEEDVDEEDVDEEDWADGDFEEDSESADDDEALEEELEKFLDEEAFDDSDEVLDNEEVF